MQRYGGLGGNQSTDKLPSTCNATIYCQAPQVLRDSARSRPSVLAAHQLTLAATCAGGWDQLGPVGAARTEVVLVRFRPAAAPPWSIAVCGSPWQRRSFGVVWWSWWNACLGRQLERDWSRIQSRMVLEGGFPGTAKREVPAQ